MSRLNKTVVTMVTADILSFDYDRLFDDNANCYSFIVD